ncbi:MAG: hypothetical protein R2834_02600 [Rhodothermales bacterium]
MARLSPLYLLLFLGLAPALRAQTVYELRAGERVRVTLATPVEVQLAWTPRTPFTGDFERFHDDVLSIARRGASLRIPAQAILQLDVSRGTQRNTWRGAALGAAAGMLGVGIAAYSRSEGCDEHAFCVFDRGYPAALGITFGMVAGGAVGVVVGSFVRTPKWVSVEVPVANGVFKPQASAGIGVRIRLD